MKYSNEVHFYFGGAVISATLCVLQLLFMYGFVHGVVVAGGLGGITGWWITKWLLTAYTEKKAASETDNEGA